MIKIIATAASAEQGKALLEVGVDMLYVGEDAFGLRLPTSFSRAEIETMVEIAHSQNKKVVVAVNALMHNDRIEKVVSYLQFLEKCRVDAITVGDPGVIHLLKKHNLNIPFIYDAQTIVTSAKQINFWAKRGATGAVLARELTYEELEAIGAQTTVPLEILVYGATCIHQSLRPLASNYLQYTNQDVSPSKKRGLYITEKNDPDSRYSIYEDINGTHIFASYDVNLLTQLDKVMEANLHHWKLDGLFTKGDDFVQIARLFVEAKNALLEKRWSADYMQQLNEKLHEYHPKDRPLDEGFFVKDPTEIE
ncbi:U32 family peptidase [Aliibacillus thermotolerans]|nr:peptidase U32 family protein [Aliibacillus thermotolerans]MDA3128473.1 U32 family peptidase [Aliibacillus thermotolerans]